MNVNTLKRRMTLALTAMPLMAGSLAGCASTGTLTTAPVTGGAKAPTHCTSWNKTRTNHWCGTPGRAWELSPGKQKSQALCPPLLDPQKMTDGTQGTKKAPVSKRDHRRVKGSQVVHLWERSRKISIDCKEDTCCYVWVPNQRWRRSRRGKTLGRPLTMGDQNLVASLSSKTPWDKAPTPIQTQPITPRIQKAIAEQWLVCAQGEHASVASFARTTLELMHVGAPAALLTDVQNAAVDEIQHASLCLELAQAYGANTVGFGSLPLPPNRPVEPSAVALYTLAEGCVAETIGALEATHAAELAQDAHVKQVLTAIAADETRHAGLAWRTLDWLVATFGRSIMDEVMVEAHRVADQNATDVGPVTEDQEVMESHGHLSPKTIQHLTDRAWKHVIWPQLRDLSERSEALAVNRTPSAEPWS